MPGARLPENSRSSEPRSRGRGLQRFRHRGRAGTSTPRRSHLSMPEIRRVIYTTNGIESLNARSRRAVRRPGHFRPSRSLKILYLPSGTGGRPNPDRPDQRLEGHPSTPWRSPTAAASTSTEPEGSH
jgi:hypothetical protein